MAGQRKPMTFKIDESAPPASVVATPAARVAKPAAANLQQVGARVTKEIYWQLKGRAGSTGTTVQSLVEQAIKEFLAKPTS
jgi:TfoX/Sxy family transcriptional regulator of competence genes